jgi:hypothetical protein
MGLLKNLSNWLTGGKTDNSVRSAAIKLRVFNKRLMRQSKKLEMTAKRAREKAVSLRKEGDMSGAKFHARNYLQTKKQARAIDNFRTNLEGLVFKMEQANAISDVSKIVKTIANSVSNLKADLSIPQITELMSSIDLDIQDFEVTQEITADATDNITMDTAVSDNQVDQVLGEIDAEIGTEVTSALPSVTSNEKIDELEKELDKLKNQE